MSLIKKIYARLGHHYYGQRKVELAAKYYLKGESEVKKLSRRLELAELLHNLDRPDEALARINKIIDETNAKLAYEKRAHILRELGRDEEALADLDKIIDNDTTYYLPWYTRGITLRDLGRYEEAAYNLQESIKREHIDSVVTTYYELAYVYYENQQFEDAVNAFQKALSFKGKEIPVYYLGLTRALDASGRVDEAITSLLQGIKLVDEFESKQDHGLAMLVERTNYSYGAFQTFRRQIQNTFSFRWELADLYAQKEDYSQAVATISDAIKLYPDKTELYLRRGVFYRYAGKWKDAETDFDHTLKLEPTLHRAYYEKAFLFRDQHDEERAHEVLLELNRLDSESPVACYRLADSYMRLERYNDALQVNQKLLALEDDDHLNYIQQGDIYQALQQMDLALNAYTQALSLDKNADTLMKRSYIYYKLLKHDEAWLDIQEAGNTDPELIKTAYYYKASGFVLKGMTNWDAAIDAFTKAIDINSGDPALYEERAECYLELSDYEQAEKDCTRGLEIDPSNPNLYNLRGYIYYSVDQFEKAQFDAENYIRLQPEMTNGYYHLGLIYYQMRQEDLALKMFNRVLSIHSFHPQSYLYKAYIHFNRVEFDECVECLVQWALYLDTDKPLDYKLNLLNDLNGLDEDVLQAANDKLTSMYNSSESDMAANTTIWNPPPSSGKGYTFH